MKTAFWKMIVLVLLALVPAGAGAQALPDGPKPVDSGSGDWNRVADLARGDEISVARAGGHSIRCEFAGATKDYLFCNPRFRDGDYRFDRAEVERVRRDDGRRNAHIAIGGLTAAGFVWGLADPHFKSNGTPRVLAGLAGGALGALSGCFVSIPVALFVPGRLIYQHPSQTVSPFR